MAGHERRARRIGDRRAQAVEHVERRRQLGDRVVQTPGPLPDRGAERVGLEP